MSKGSSSTASSGGIGVFGLLGVAFVVLKLCGVIDWSWWFVTLPFWGGLALVIAFFLSVLLAAASYQGALAVVEKVQKEKLKQKQKEAKSRLQ